MNLYYVIDRVPEFPYFVLALAFVFTNPPEASLHVFSVAFIFMVASIFLGLSIKVLFKTKRPVNYPCVPIARYDIPSLHTLISVGAVAFTYFVNPLYAFILAPVGVFYMYSRVRLCVHTKKAVYVGALVGLVMGVFFGMSLHVLSFPGYEHLLTAFFFLTPVSATVFRLRYLRYGPSSK